MYGLLSRSHVTAAKMGFATRGPNIRAMSGTADGSLGVARVVRSIDHTICSVSSKLRPQREARIAARRTGYSSFKITKGQGSWRGILWFGRDDHLLRSDRRRLSKRRAQAARQGWPQATAAGGAKRP